MNMAAFDAVVFIPSEPNAAVASVTNVTSHRPLRGCVAEYRAISQTRPDVGRGGIRTIVSIAMRRARESPVRPIARIGCCVPPATNFIYPTSRPLSLSGLLAFVANDRMPARWLCGSVDSVYGRDQCGFFASWKRSQRSTGSKRSAPWNGSTHPGYSGGSTLTSSNCLSSS